MKTYEAGVIVRRALERGRQAGMSLMEQTEHAVNALRQVDPDITAEQAIQAVRRVRQAQQDERTDDPSVERPRHRAAH